MVMFFNGSSGPCASTFCLIVFWRITDRLLPGSTMYLTCWSLIMQIPWISSSSSPVSHCWYEAVVWLAWRLVTFTVLCVLVFRSFGYVSGLPSGFEFVFLVFEKLRFLLWGLSRLLLRLWSWLRSRLRSRLFRLKLLKLWWPWKVGWYGLVWFDWLGWFNWFDVCEMYRSRS